ncbi:unnamed protein product [Thelazia callipaeda]|uniref:Secreted protein n=1 Tax=Thelazia callipaeda TaxID=103827 RepID=A0A0N5CL23_THECL|nr:unnamed protein product [Thelazia callipaeda]
MLHPILTLQIMFLELLLNLDRYLTSLKQPHFLEMLLAKRVVLYSGVVRQYLLLAVVFSVKAKNPVQLHRLHFHLVQV